MGKSSLSSSLPAKPSLGTSLENTRIEIRKVFRSWENYVTCKARRLDDSRAEADVQRWVRELNNSWWTEKDLEETDRLG